MQKIVYIHFEFIQIGEVDIVNEKYNGQIRITSKWYEDELMQEYDPKINWNPKLYIENSVYDKFDQKIEYEIKHVVDNNKTLIIETRLIHGVFWERMELNDFPFDIQGKLLISSFFLFLFKKLKDYCFKELSISLMTEHKPNKCKLTRDEYKQSMVNAQALNSFKDQQKYNLYRFVQITNQSSYDSNFTEFELFRKRSKIVATMFCSRKPVYYLVNFYLYNFLITALALTLFVVDLKFVQNRISSSFTLILTSFNFKIITSKSLPTVSYFTSLEKYQIINLIFLAICCIWHSVIASLNLDLEERFYLDKIVLILFLLVFILIQFIFILSMWISYLKVKMVKEIEKQFVFNLMPLDISMEVEPKDYLANFKI